jgi:hypothetical protein
MVGLGTKFSTKLEKNPMDNQTFVTELSKLRPGSTFLTLRGYRNEASEIADYSIAFHFSYENALKKSIEVLAKLDLQGDLEKQARHELLDSFAKSLARGAASPELEERDPTFSYFKDNAGNYVKGVKLHDKTNTLHLYGLVVHKRVLMPGLYADKNRRPLTVAKDKLRHLTPVGKFRSFKMTPFQVDSIAVENISLLPPE